MACLHAGLPLHILLSSQFSTACFYTCQTRAKLTPQLPPQPPLAWIFRKLKLACICEILCTFNCLCAWVRTWKVEEDVRSPQARVTRGCEPPGEGAVNWILQKQSVYVLPLGCVQQAQASPALVPSFWLCFHIQGIATTCDLFSTGRISTAILILCILFPVDLFSFFSWHRLLPPMCWDYWLALLWLVSSFILCGCTGRYCGSHSGAHAPRPHFTSEGYLSSSC